MQPRSGLRSVKMTVKLCLTVVVITLEFIVVHSQQPLASKI